MMIDYGATVLNNMYLTLIGTGTILNNGTFNATTYSDTWEIEYAARFINLGVLILSGSHNIISANLTSALNPIGTIYNAGTLLLLEGQGGHWEYGVGSPGKYVQCRTGVIEFHTGQNSGIGTQLFYEPHISGYLKYYFDSGTAPTPDQFELNPVKIFTWFYPASGVYGVNTTFPPCSLKIIDYSPHSMGPLNVCYDSFYGAAYIQPNCTSFYQIYQQPFGANDNDDCPDEILSMITSAGIKVIPTTTSSGGSTGSSTSNGTGTTGSSGYTSTKITTHHASDSIRTFILLLVMVILILL